MKVKGKLLNNLRIVLLESCHAEECHRVSKCPKICGCNSRRTFKLNTETAICWEIADRLGQLVGNGYNHPLKKDVEDLIAAADGYYNISRFHMSRGWEKFFMDIRSIIIALTLNPSYLPDSYRDKNIMNQLRGRLKRLKRYPRE